MGGMGREEKGGGGQAGDMAVGLLCISPMKKPHACC